MKGKWWKKHASLSDEFKNVKTAFAPEAINYHPANAYWLAYCADRAYKGEGYLEKHSLNSWGFDQFDFIKRSDTQCFVASTDKFVIVTFRGTEKNSVKDIVTDLDMGFSKGYNGRVHSGFKDAYEGVKEKLELKLAEHQAREKTVWVSGHSLGGALAVLAAHDLHEKDYRVHGLYTIGQPRVGDSSFTKSLDTLMQDRYFRFSHKDDKAPGVPDKKLGYKHGGKNIYILSRSRLALRRKKSNKVTRFIKSLVNTLSAHSSSNYAKAIRKNIMINPFSTKAPVG